MTKLAKLHDICTDCHSTSKNQKNSVFSVFHRVNRCVTEMSSSAQTRWSSWLLHISRMLHHSRIWLSVFVRFFNIVLCHKFTYMTRFNNIYNTDKVLQCIQFNCTDMHWEPVLVNNVTDGGITEFCDTILYADLYVKADIPPDNEKDLMWCSLKQTFKSLTNYLWECS